MSCLILQNISQPPRDKYWTTKFLSTCRTISWKTEVRKWTHSRERILHCARIYCFHTTWERGFDKLINLLFFSPKHPYCSNPILSLKQCLSNTSSRQPQMLTALVHNCLFRTNRARETEKCFFGLNSINQENGCLGFSHTLPGVGAGFWVLRYICTLKSVLCVFIMYKI